MPHIIFLNSLKTMFRLQLVDCMNEENKKKYYKHDKKLSKNQLKKNMIANCVSDKFNTEFNDIKKIPYIKLTRHDRKRDISKFFDN